ncbi:MAG: hypothetical protein J6R79_06385 [Bacteroidaceae bacterium]|nr:hypothetical protein [Bacteroidaceae bacterium]
MIRNFCKLMVASAGMALTASCSEVECPLDSVVVMTCDLKDATTGGAFQLTDSLTIKPMGKDTIMLNRAQGISSFVLPLKLGETTDTFLLRFADEWENVTTDTLILTHYNQPHFESMDCPATYFHTITDVAWKNQNKPALNIFIDTVTIKRALVDYENTTNIQIYLRTTL